MAVQLLGGCRGVLRLARGLLSCKSRSRESLPPAYAVLRGVYRGVDGIKWMEASRHEPTGCLI